MTLSSFVPLSAPSAEDSDDDIPLAEFAQRMTSAGLTFTYFVTADTDLIVTEEMTDGDIVTELLEKNNNHTEHSSDSEPEENHHHYMTWPCRSISFVADWKRNRISAKNDFLN